MKEEYILTLQLYGVERKKLEELIYVNFESTDELLKKFKEKFGLEILLEKFHACYEKALELLLLSKKLEIMVLAPSDDKFPNTLKQIPNSPMLLFVKGNISLLATGKLVAVVGTRTPSKGSLQFSYDISKDFAQQGITTVSGLAEGIDTAAHEGSLAGGGGTIAVLAHGLDYIYPQSNVPLAKAILANGGCLVSEYPPSFRPQKHTFVERNRLQSGLSDGVIVVECAEQSGTMHTAKFCKTQHKNLACLVISGQLKQQATGNQMLINKYGAFAIKDKTDVEKFVSTFGFSKGITFRQLQLDTFFSAGVVGGAKKRQLISKESEEQKPPKKPCI